MPRVLSALCLLPLPLLVPACSSETPEITGCDARLLWVQDSSGAFSRRLSVFVLFRSGDDRANFGSMTVRHEASDIEWNLDAAHAVAAASSDRRDAPLWVGYPAFAPVYAAGGEEFPAGRYTVRARDLAGSEALASFSLEESVHASAPPLSLNVFRRGRNERVWRLSLRAEARAPDTAAETESDDGDTSESARADADVSADAGAETSAAEIAASGGVFIFLLDGAGKPLSAFPVPAERFADGVAEGGVSEFEEALDAVDGKLARNLRQAQCFATTGKSSGVLLFPLSLGYDDDNE